MGRQWKRIGNPLAGRWRWALLFAGALGLWLWALISGWPGQVTAVDLEQTRANRVAPSPGETVQLRQNFVAGRDGLAQIELLLAVKEGSTGEGRFRLHLLDEAGATLAQRQAQSGELSHNQIFTLPFELLPDSAGKTYTLLVSGTAGNEVTLWGYDLDVIAGGALQVAGADSDVSDLYLVTRYRLGLSSALGRLAEMLAANAGLILLALALIFMPGWLFLALIGRRLGLGNAVAHDPVARWGLALALGLSLWPLLWMWLTVVGGRWRDWSLGVTLLLGWAVIIWRTTFHGSRPKWQSAIRDPQSNTVTSPRPTPHALLLFLLLLLTFALRLLAVRDLAFPPWVDSTRHALITAVMSGSGQTMGDYAPLLPVERFPYHYGFHTVSAGLALIGDFPLPRMLLILGQLLNALMPLAIYSGAYLITRRRWTALAAAFLVALPFFFPAYYATWGRMTQLTGMLILPVALGLTWQIVRGARRGRHIWLQAGMAAILAILTAGLFLVHFRVFALFLPFAALVWMVSFGRGGRRLALAAVMALLLVAPRIAALLADTEVTALTGSIPGYNVFPAGYVQAGWERYYLAAGGLVLLFAVLAAIRARSWPFAPLLLAGWVGLVAILLAGDRLGLPETSLLNLNSAYISAFAPLAIILGLAVDRIGRWLARRPGVVQAPALALTGAAIMSGALFGARQQLTILNPQTILAQPADADGLAWLAANTPETARVAVSSWRWLSDIYAGSDGGAWIVPLTGRASSTPPVDHIYNRDLAQEVISFNEAALAIEDWSTSAAAEWLRDRGISHIFTGVRGRLFDPSALAQNPAISLGYASAGVFVFELE